MVSSKASIHRKLIEEAKKSRSKAYAPFSRFKVGAALQTKSGEIYCGANVENSSYGLTNCAERTAVFKAVTDGHARKGAITTIAIVADTSGPCSPCGACRQVIFEFGGDIEVVMTNLKGDTVVKKIKNLLPDGFRLT